jgi:type II secretory pathway pseudopilin PulG
MGMRSKFKRYPRTTGRERGYILLTLVLVMALLIIAAGTAATSIAFSIRRDREEELVHRGVQYTRAIRAFTKSNGRYPLRVEELVHNGNTRYLRRAYKDPVTGKDFKLLTFSDIPGNSPQPIANGTAPTTGGGATAGGPSFGAAPASNAATTAPDAGATDGASDSPGGTTSPGNPTGASNQTQNPVTGGAICGVASTSRSHTIREFNRKNRYNEWLFFYLPNYDNGLPIKGPTPLTPPIGLIQPSGAPGQSLTQPQGSPQQPSSPQSPSPQPSSPQQ